MNNSSTKSLRPLYLQKSRRKRNQLGRSQGITIHLNRRLDGFMKMAMSWMKGRLRIIIQIMWTRVDQIQHLITTDHQQALGHLDILRHFIMQLPDKRHRRVGVLNILKIITLLREAMLVDHLQLPHKAINQAMLATLDPNHLWASADLQTNNSNKNPQLLCHQEHTLIFTETKHTSTTVKISQEPDPHSSNTIKPLQGQLILDNCLIRCRIQHKRLQIYTVQCQSRENSAHYHIEVRQLTLTELKWKKEFKMLLILFLSDNWILALNIKIKN